MKPVCCDTSFIVSLYGNDSNSNKALAITESLHRPVTLSDLNYFELEQAIHFLIWRRQLSSAQGQWIKEKFASDCASGAMLITPCNFTNVLATARRLSASYTPAAGHRAMDILQVAAAIELDADVFLSFDANQRKLAQAEGLKLNP